MNKTFPKIWITIILIVLIVAGISTWQNFGIPGEETTEAAGQKISVVDWTGVYEYREFAPSDQRWIYILKIYKEEGRLKARLDIDGFQTLARIQAVAKENNKNLDIVFNNYRSKNIYTPYQKGDLLFSLQETSNQSYKIIWHRLKSNLLKPPTAEFKKLGNAPAIEKKKPQNALKLTSTFSFLKEEAPKGETANWKTYSNKEYGFEVKYPPHFYLEEIPPHPPRKYGEIFTVGFGDEHWKKHELHLPAAYITVIKASLTPLQWLEVYGTPINTWFVDGGPLLWDYLYLGVSDVTTAKINNIPVVQFRHAGASGSNRTTLFKKEPDILYKIDAHSCANGNLSDEIYVSMLSSFRFIGKEGEAKALEPIKENSSRDNWRTYKNEKYGFQFKYPSVPLGCEQCKIYESSDGFNVNRTNLVVKDSGGLSLSDFADKQMEGFAIENREERLIGATRGIRIDYRFGGMNRVGRIAFVEKKNKIFIFSFTAGGFCCGYKAGRIYEADVFGAMLSTFRFSEGATDLNKKI